MIARLRTYGLNRNLEAAHLVLLGIVAVCPMATAQTPANLKPAASAFKANCAICHAEDGSGTALGNRLHVKDLRAREVQQKSSSELAEVIVAGKDNMPSFRDRLTSEQVQQLIEYIHLRARRPKQAAPHR